MAKNKNNKPKNYKKLTKNIPPTQIPLLTTKNDGVFRVAFAGEAEIGYDFKDIDISDWYNLGQWLDGNVGKKIGEIAGTKYGRKTDRNDKKKDPYAKNAKNQQHFSFFGKRRVHGYFNQYGYFTITRIDPGHNFHKRK